MALTRKPIVKKEDKIEVSVNDIQWIKETLSTMSLKLQEMDITLIKVNQTVIGDNIYGQKGLVEQVKEHQKYIDTDKDFKSKLVGGGFAVGILWTIILKFWDKIF
jgi:glycerol-3-phosphate cytidylyltransferase-like family protein